VKKVPESTDAEEEIQASQPEPRREITAAETRDFLDQLARLLRFALRDEGLHLWEMRYLDGNLLRPTRKLLAREIEEELRPDLEALEAVFSTLMELPWADRAEPLSLALEKVEKGLNSLPEASVEMAAASEVLLKVQSPGPNKKEEREEGKRRRGRRRGRAKKQNDEQPEPEAPSRRAPAHNLGDPEFTGKALSDLEGADTALVDALKLAGIETVKDLILLPPTRHANLKCAREPKALKAKGEVGVTGKVVARWSRLAPNSCSHELELAWDEASIRASWDSSEPPRLPAVGERLSLVGPVSEEDGNFSMSNPVVWRADSRGTIRLPVYGIEAVDDVALSNLIRAQLSWSLPGLRESLPDNVLRMGNVLGLRDAIRELHVPLGGIRHGRTRFVFEELFRHQLDQAAKERSHRKGLAHPIQHDLISQLQLQHGILLNDGQEVAFDEIRRDLARPLAMNRLLQGDVGSGKAVVSLLSAIAVASSRSQVLFVAPDALAAEHRYLFAEPLLRSVGLVPQLITGKPSAGQLDAIKRGQANLIFATPDFIDPVLPEFKRLGLTVVEERSSFGNITAERFVQGKVYSDFLVVTSMPVPPSLAFSIFSDVDISVIQAQVESVECVVAQPGERDGVYDALREILDSGRQAYVVFPMRDGGDIIDRQRGEVLAGAMAQEAFPGHQVALFHGSMNREERFKVFDDFLHRRIDVLIATTAIEDAPEVDNAIGVMVENADHFDLVRLYRLRGHVNSKAVGAKCFFVLSKDPSKSGAKLVDFVAQETDPFSLAEKDREERGDEALLGDGLSDLPEFVWADLSVDRDVLLKARRTVFAILSNDPALERKIYRGLVDGPTKAAIASKESRDSKGSQKRRRPRRRRRRGGDRKESSG